MIDDISGGLREMQDVDTLSYILALKLSFPRDISRFLIIAVEKLDAFAQVIVEATSSDEGGKQTLGYTVTRAQQEDARRI